MHRMWALLAALLILPGVQALTWDDPAEDQEMGRGVAEGDGAPDRQWIEVGPYGMYEQADVREASIEETPESLIFKVGLTSLDGEGFPESPGFVGTGPEIDRWRYVWEFTFRGEDLVAGFTVREGHDFQLFSVGEILERDGFTIELSRVLTIAEVRDDMPGYVAEVPKWWFRDSEGVPIIAGDRLEDLTFAALDGRYFRYDGVRCPRTDPTSPQGPFGWRCGWTVRDLMQDGQSLGDFEVTESPPGVDHLFLQMVDPIRLSNGLATTYLFEARIHNTGDEPDTFSVQVADIPDGWEVHHPAVVSVGADSAKTVPLALQVPFNHEHGAERILRLTALSDLDPSVSMSTWFGVVYADPPQPAGHHSRLHLHANEDGWWTWMNTLTDDPDGTKVPVGPDRVDFGAGTIEAEWNLRLRPSLHIGLDFDTPKDVRVRVPLEFDADFEGTVEGRMSLYSWREDDRIVLAEGSVDGFSAAGGTATEVPLDLAVQAVADRIPPKPGYNLELDVYANGTVIQNPFQFWFGDERPGPYLHTEEAWIDLPLADYHDEVDLSGLAVAAFNLEALNGTYRYVNPGNTTVFAFNVTNLQDSQQTLDWDLRGPDRFLAWASLSTTTTHLKPDGRGLIVVRVQAPPDAEDEDIAELLLLGRAREDADRQVFSPITADVETTRAIDDESGFATGLEKEAEKANRENKRDTPLPLLVALTALGWAWRRRR